MNLEELRHQSEQGRTESQGFSSLPSASSWVRRNADEPLRILGSLTKSPQVASFHGVLCRTMDLFCFPRLVEPAESFLCCLSLGVGVKLLMWPHQALTLYTVAAVCLAWTSFYRLERANTKPLSAARPQRTSSPATQAAPTFFDMQLLFSSPSKAWYRRCPGTTRGDWNQPAVRDHLVRPTASCTREAGR